MTRLEYSDAYANGGFKNTIAFLRRRGLKYSAAEELAQAAWVKGWERLGQLRNANFVRLWVNTIALNRYRSDVRRPPTIVGLSAIPGHEGVDFAAIDLAAI